MPRRPVALLALACRLASLSYVLLVLPQPADGWSVYADKRTPIDFANATAAMASAIRWSYKRPLIRWAISPDFCSSIQPLLVENKGIGMPFSFRLQNFTTCERIVGIIRNGFDVWAQANPALQFVDVTERCEAERMWRPVDEEECAESAWCLIAENATGADFIDWKAELTPLELNPSTEAWKCSLRTCWQCDRADVMIGGFTQKNRRLGDQHAKARVRRFELSEQPPLSPNGQPAEGKTVERAWLEFNVDDEYKNVDADDNGLGNATVENCWRIDNDVCDWVISLPTFKTGSDVNFAITVSFWSIFAASICACCFLVYGLMMRLAANLLTGWDVDRDGKLELSEIGYVLDEFCGEVCFECRCPTVHHKKLTALSGLLSVLETISQTTVILPTLLISCILALVLLYFDGVQRCFDCRDFRASVIHEVGHLLSLDHATGAESTIPLIRAPAPSPPPPPMNQTTGELLNGTFQHVNTTKPWFGMYDPTECADSVFGVIIDPVVSTLLSPPPTPPPSPSPPHAPAYPACPPPTPPPPMVPIDAYGLNYSEASNVGLVSSWIWYSPPINATPSNSFVGRMGSYSDLNESVMIVFGTIGRERPIAGRPRRCLASDDSDGVNFLYPGCGIELPTPPCEYVMEVSFVGERLLESLLKLTILPLLVILSAKVLAALFLVLEDRIASWQVKRLAKRLLDEAAVAEEKRKETHKGTGVSGRFTGFSRGITRSLKAFTPNRPVTVQPTDGESEMTAPPPEEEVAPAAEDATASFAPSAAFSSSASSVS